MYNNYVMQTTVKTTAAVITEAIAPHRSKAQDRAVELTQHRIDAILAKVAECGGNPGKAFPLPKTTLAQAEYRKQYALYTLARRLYTARPMLNGKVDFMVRRNVVADMLEDARELAGKQFDEYVAKLAHKVGDGVVRAEVYNRNGIWSDSDLRVEFADGRIETWNTKVITNYSKHDLAYNQFPTRKCK